MSDSIHLFKRYAGRRLFDFTEKRYVTHQYVHDCLRKGEQVCVLEGGRDITGAVVMRATAEAIDEGRSRVGKPLYLAALLSLIHTADRVFEETD